MRNSFALAFLCSTAAVAAASAQTTTPARPGQNTPQAQAAPGAQGQAATIADCDRLIVVLEREQIPNAPVTLQTARVYKRDANAQACRDALTRVQQASNTNATGQQQAEAGRITVQQPAPNIQVQQQPPQVTVQQAQPDVTVRQQRPQISVRQPAPTITVDIPQPEIVVRMPEPDVNVAMARPQVQVNQPQPQVQVTRPQEQANVQIERQANAEANVRVEGAEQQPEVRYERAQPRVVVNQPTGEPQVRYERMNAADAAAQRDTDGAPAQANQQAQADPATRPTNPARDVGASSATDTAASAGVANAAAANTRMVAISDLTNYNLYNARGDQLGDVERVVQGPNGQPQIVIGHGGFLGLGEKRVAVPLENVWVRGDRLVTRGLNDDQIRAMPAWQEKAGGREMASSQTVRVSTSE